MAKEQMVKTFREGSKYYIVVENPTKEVEAKLNALFGDVAGDLASILAPQTKEEPAKVAEEIDAKVSVPNQEQKMEPVSEPAPEPATTTQDEPQKVSDLPVVTTKQEAQNLLREYLSAGQFSKRAALVILNPKMREKVEAMTEAEAEQIWASRNLEQVAIRISGYAAPTPTPAPAQKTLAWV